MSYGNLKVNTITTSTKTVAVDNLLDNSAGSITSAMIADGTIVNGDISASAAIADSKLATISTAGKVSGGAITSGTIGGSTAISTTGSIATTGTVAIGLASPAANVECDVSGAYASNIVSVAALDINCSAGNTFTKTISSNSTFTFSNVPSNRSYSFALEVVHSSGTITWPASVTWPGNTAPTLTTNRTHIFIFFTDDGGTKWRGCVLKDYTS